MLAQLGAQRLRARPVAGREEDGVVAGDRARDAGMPALVDRLGERARVAGRSREDDERPGPLDAGRVAAHRDADRTEPVGVVGAGRCVDESARGGPNLREPQLLDVARDRRLHDVVALLTERLDELALRGDRPVAHEPEDRLLPDGVAHASASARRARASSTSASVTTSGGQEAKHVGAGGEREEAVLAACVDDRARVTVEHRREKQAAASHVEHSGEPAQPGGELLAPGGDVREQRVVDRLDHRARRSAGDRVPAEGRAVVTRADRVGDAVAHEQRADREARCRGLSRA